MRFHCTPILVGVILIAAGAARGQDAGAKTDPSPRPDATAVEVRFADDSTVKMVLLHDGIEIATRYGKLTVPVGEIRRIEFGRHVSEETAKRIDAAIARLGNPDFKQREAASADLVALAEVAYPALQQAARSDVAEVARRAKAAIKTLTETLPADKLHLAPHDTLVAADFTIVGRIEATGLKVRTPYFGDTSLKLADVRVLRSLAGIRETKVTIDAARYGGPQEAWLDTGVDVRSGVVLQIAASGTVDLRPTVGEAGTLMSGPDGLSARGPRGAGGGGFPGAAGGGRGAMPRPAGGTPTSGVLLGRVGGEFGKVFIVGSRFEGAAPEDGKLYLRIVPSSNGNESSGSYDVRVTGGR